MQCTLLGLFQKLERVDFLVELQALEMVEFWFVRLDFRKISVVKVSRVLEVGEAENDDATSFITNGKKLTCVVEVHGREDVRVANVRGITLTKTVDVDPLEGLL